MGIRAGRLGLLVAAAAALMALAPAAQALTLKPGDILVANYQDYSTTAKEGVIRIDPATGKMTVVSSNAQPVNSGSSELFIGGAWDLALLPDGELVVTDADGAVIGVNPTTGKQRLVSSNSQAINSGSSEYFNFPTGVVRLPNGDLAVAGNPPNSVVEVDFATGKQSILSSNDQPVNVGSAYYSSPYDLTTGVGGALVVADTGAFGDGGLISVDPTTGKQTKLSANDQPINASSQLFDSGPASAHLYRGEFFVSDVGTDPRVIAVKAATGKQRLVSANTQPINSSSQYYNNIYGITVEPGGRILVSEETELPSAGGVISVNPLTGKQTLLASNDTAPNSGTSELISYPDGIMVVPPKCAGLYPTIVGTSAKDTLKGTPFPDIIAGLGGRDTIRGLGGADRLCGGPGPDLLVGGKGRDRLIGAKGRDRLRGGPGRDVLRGGPGRDRQRQ